MASRRAPATNWPPSHLGSQRRAAGLAPRAWFRGLASAQLAARRCGAQRVVARVQRSDNLKACLALKAFGVAAPRTRFIRLAARRVRVSDCLGVRGVASVAPADAPARCAGDQRSFSDPEVQAAAGRQRRLSADMRQARAPDARCVRPACVAAALLRASSCLGYRVAFPESDSLLPLPRAQ